MGGPFNLSFLGGMRLRCYQSDSGIARVFVAIIPLTHIMHMAAKLMHTVPMQLKEQGLSLGCYNVVLHVCGAIFFSALRTILSRALAVTTLSVFILQ